MKKYALPLALVSVLGLQACNQQTSTGDAAAPAAPAEVALETTEQRLSYGIAYGLGQRMAADGVPMDVDAFSAGLRDAVTEALFGGFQGYLGRSCGRSSVASGSLLVTGL